jgi:hypothetical protein
VRSVPGLGITAVIAARLSDPLEVEKTESLRGENARNSCLEYGPERKSNTLPLGSPNGEVKSKPGFSNLGRSD